MVTHAKSAGFEILGKRRFSQQGDHGAADDECGIPVYLTPLVAGARQIRQNSQSGFTVAISDGLSQKLWLHG